MDENTTDTKYSSESEYTNEVPNHIHLPKYAVYSGLLITMLLLMISAYLLGRSSGNKMVKPYPQPTAVLQTPQPTHISGPTGAITPTTIPISDQETSCCSKEKLDQGYLCQRCGGPPTNPNVTVTPGEYDMCLSPSDYGKTPCPL